MIKKVTGFFLAVFLSAPMIAQEFTGQIMNNKQRPLKGLKVWRKNTTESTVTDKSGFFAFARLTPQDTLVIAASRKKDAIIPVEGFNRLSIRIEQEFFIINAGEKDIQREYVKKQSASAFDSNVLTREQIDKIPASTIYELLKGTIAGVTVNDGPSGQQVSIRGGNSFDLNTEPLFVIDGTIYESSSAADSAISINDIERLEVLKDGSMYGMKGSNGVILIKTLKK